MWGKRGKKGKRKANKVVIGIEKELDVLRSVTTATQEPNKDEFDTFGQYVATKMRKLSQALSEDAMEAIEYDITTVLLKVRCKQGPSHTWSCYQFQNA